jgi:hypothetical protein
MMCRIVLFQSQRTMRTMRMMRTSEWHGTSNERDVPLIPSFWPSVREQAAAACLTLAAHLLLLHLFSLFS